MVNYDRKYSSKLYSKEHLKHRNDISVFFKNENDVKRLSNHQYTIFVLKNNRSYSRFAVTIKRNKANAVNRNRAKRIVREIYRQNKSQIPVGYDFFVVIKDVKIKNKFDDYYSYSFNDFSNCRKKLLNLFKKV